MQVTVELAADASLDSVTQELLRLKKLTGGNPTKLGVTYVAVLEKMERLGYSKQRKGLAKLILSKPNKTKDKQQIQTSTHKNTNTTDCVLNSDNPASGVDVSILPTKEIRKLLFDQIHAHFLLVDPDVVDVLLASALTHYLPGPPAWLFLVGPSGGGKTELLGLLNCLEDVIRLSEVTRNTFFSGLGEDKAVGGGEAAFLNRHPHAILAFKDFTTMLSLRAETRTEIMGQLREIFDGNFDKPYGTGLEMEWQGRITTIAAVTSAIDDHHKLMSALGPRFLLLRFKQPPRYEIGLKAFNQPVNWSQEARRLVRALFKSIDLTKLPTFSQSLIDSMIALTNFITIGRSPTTRVAGELTGETDPEMATRLLRQFKLLSQGLALLNSREEVNQDDFARLIRIGWETLPPARNLVLSQLVSGPKSNAEIRKATGRFSTYIGDAIQELQVLGMVHSLAETVEYEDNAKWDFTPTARALLATFS
jgi:hypothetical protein